MCFELCCVLLDICVLCPLLCILISWLDTGGVLRCMLCFAFQVVLCIADVLVLMLMCVDVCWCVLMFFVVCFDILTWYRWRFKMYDVFSISSCAVYCWCVGVDVLMCVDVCWWVHLTLMWFCFFVFCVDFVCFKLLSFVIQDNFQKVLARRWVKDDLISWLDTGDVLRCMMCIVFQVVVSSQDIKTHNKEHQHTSTHINTHQHQHQHISNTQHDLKRKTQHTS